MSINIGISDNHRQTTAKVLEIALADTFTLYLKTHNFHWNVTGPHFYMLHLLLEKQYEELQEASDTIAERIRALGFPAPGSYSAFAKLTSIKEAIDVPSANEMIKQLAEDNEKIASTIREMFEKIEPSQDEATLDMLTERLAAHEQAAWMLRSSLG